MTIASTLLWMVFALDAPPLAAETGGKGPAPRLLPTTCGTVAVS